MNKPPERLPKGSEADKFKELARKLVAVPKKEVDEQKERYEREKEKGPAPKK